MTYHDRCSSRVVLIFVVAFTVQGALSNTVKTQSHSLVSARSKRQVRAPIPSQLGGQEGSAHRQNGRREPWINDRRPVTSRECSCDDIRLSQAVGNIANLVRRMGEQEDLSKENKDVIQTLVQSNRQLQSQITRVVSENMRLTRLVRSLRSDSSSRLSADRQLHTGTEDQNQQADPVTVQQRSSLHELNDVIGNREAEMMEMGIFPPVKPPTPVGSSRTSFASSAGQSFQRPDSEQIATSRLLLNQENLARKIEKLQVRMDQGKQPTTVESTQSRQTPGITSELEDKISELERLVLVALQTPSEGRQIGADRPLSRVSTSRGIPDSVAAVERMSDDDLDALVNVVDRVQNKGPRKSAFSVACTGITLGVNEDPKAIEFDHEFVNKGGDFKRRQSRFVCEHPGFYYITFTLRSYDGKYLGVALMKNEELQTAVYADSNDRNIMQTQGLILHLEDGDEVWLRHAPSDNFAVHSGVHRYITFSGFLIYKGY